MAEPRTILCVDDDRDFLEMERRILAGGGYRVACFSDPAAAVAAMNASVEAPALVVTDLMMSSLDSGFALARRLKDDPRFAAVPVSIVTAVSRQKGFDFSPKGEADLAAMGADAFFDKPVAPQALLAKVKELLG